MFKKTIISACFFLVLLIRPYAQVNLQTGSATFSLPMFSWQDDKSRLNSVVALSYNSGNGLKVNEIASNAGQGWSLISGGEIVRMQAGEPDDQVARSGNEYDITKYPPGILYATVPAANGCPEALTKYPIYGWKNQMYSQHNTIAEDKQLDYFSFQFNGKAGMFVLDPANIGVAKSLGDTKMKITFQQDANLISLGIRTKITSFSIQDVDGLIYKFTLHGLSKLLKTEYCDDNYSYKQTQPKFKDGKVFYQSNFDDGSIINPWIIGSWHLTEIEDALTHRKIFFNYTVRNINAYAGDDISYNQTNKNYGIVSRKKSVTQTPEISSVVYPDGHTVSVNYGNARVDLNGGYAISSVDVSYQGRYLSKYELNTSYFILNRYGTPVSDYEKRVARLCLRSVKKIGIDLKEDTPPYIFEYNTGSSASDDFVPPPFSYAKDIWGFYNGGNTMGYWYENIPLTASVNTIKNSNHIKGICYLRDGVSGVYLNAKPGYAKNGLLRQIIYPTGGTLRYQYGQNTGLLNGNNTNVGGVHVMQTSSTDGGYSNGCGNPIVTNYNYVMNGPGSNSSLWGLEMPKNSIVSHNHYQPEWRSYKWSLSCVPFGCCYWHFQYPGIMTRQQAINMSGVQRAMEAVSPVLGIVSILGTIQSIATVVGGGSPVSLIIDVVTGLVQLAVTCIGDNARDNTATIYFNTDLNAAAPLPVQFKRVEVEESPGTIGKTVQEFTSEDDYPIWEPTNPNFVAKQRFAPWAYGLPKITTVYDANGFKVKETENEYSFPENTCQGGLGNFSELASCPQKVKQPLNVMSCLCKVKKSLSQRSTNWSDPNQYNSPTSYSLSSTSNMDVDMYDLYSGRTELKKTFERIYKPANSNEFTETKTEYGYNTSMNFEVNAIRTYASNGDVITKEIRYTPNYTGGIINTLLNNNIVSLPISTLTKIVKGSATSYLNENVTEYTQLSNGDIKPFRIIEQRFSEPKSSSAMTFYQGPGTSISNYSIPQTFTYDATGNLIGIKDEGNRAITNIYGYNDKYVIASVINADPAVDKAAYTSFETTGNQGNWTINGSPVYVTTNTATGSSAFLLVGSNGLSVSGLTTSKPYTLSFWSSTATVTVSAGASLIKSAPAYNGTTYYEYDIVQGTSSISIGGTGIIDEVRLFPKTARMRTTTYDPLIGKTSECDENNRITYYEYDRLGRLLFVKDEKKNIVKMHEYNNISSEKQNGCPGVYYNHFISQVYVKDCGPGYQGTEVVYSVPANMYSSTLSQQDADAQAEYNLLTNGQVYANNTGRCQQIYYSVSMSVTKQTESCSPGFTGGMVTYTVPAARYTSLVSQADADEKALEDLEANADTYINSPPNAICVYSSAPLWVWPEGGASQCQLVNGENHLFIEEVDMNPNSSSYGSTRWSDVGPHPDCPAASCNYTNCDALQGEGYTCINGICELGIRVNTGSTYQPSTGMYECTYHYEYSNGSWSQNYFTYSYESCYD